MSETKARKMTRDEKHSGRGVTSSDPRKPRIMDALKKASGCPKVTSVREQAPGVFIGECMWASRRPAPDSCEQGLWLVELPELARGT